MSLQDTSGYGGTAQGADLASEEDDPIKKAIRASLPPPAAEGPTTEVKGMEDIPGTFGGGIGGGLPPPSDAGPGAGALGGGTPVANDYKKLGQYAGQMGAWSQDPNNPQNEKFKQPWDQQSERYKMLTVLSNFDPTKGITPDVLDALNKADIHGAKFSGSGDKLDVNNAGNWDRFGKGGVGDINVGFKTGHGQWNPWSDPALEGQGGGGPDTGAAGPTLGGGNAVNPLLINPALGSSEFFQELMKRAQSAAGPGSTDQNALLSLLGK